jgi:AcrR family transcriptional regulator
LKHPRKQAAPDIRLADAALRLLKKEAWRDLSLATIAKAAKVPMTELATHAPSKPVLIGLILRRLGEEATRAYKADADTESARDRLFDVSMVWFDTLARHEEAVRSLYEGLRNDPVTLLAARNMIIAAAEWLMTLAEADTGPALALRAAAFAAILGRTIPVWLEDDADLSKTMARLDTDLRRGESLLGKL